MNKYAVVYDGSRYFTIGLLPDPQGEPICSVWDHSIEAGQAKADLVCDALNSFALKRELMEALKRLMDSGPDANFDYDALITREEKSL